MIPGLKRSNKEDFRKGALFLIYFSVAYVYGGMYNKISKNDRRFSP